LLEIQFAIDGGFIYYLGRVYRAYRGEKGGNMVEGDDWELSIMKDCVTIHCDSQSSIHLADHQIYHKRMKYFMIDVVESGEDKIKKIALEKNSTYVFTKSLPGQDSNDSRWRIVMIALNPIQHTI